MLFTAVSPAMEGVPPFSKFVRVFVGSKESAAERLENLPAGSSLITVECSKSKVNLIVVTISALVAQFAVHGCS
jgi:hypothetical protein